MTSERNAAARAVTENTKPSYLPPADPIIGLQEPGASFTIPRESERRRLHGIATFNVLRGGEFLFVPSITALGWLANLNG